MTLSSFILGYWGVIEWSILIIAVIILISSLDDLFIDLIYWYRQTWRRLVVRRRHPPLPIERLGEVEEKPFAIMIPAWKEAGVIGRMLENTVESLQYSRYVIFVGSYENDPETGTEIDRMARRIRNLRHVVVPKPGPTCKADCLNWLVQGIFDYEKRNKVEFAGIVLHDSEDIIHPLELKLFNYLVPRKDMIQLPVLSLEREWHEFVAGTYIDDFAEWHSKDLVVRETLTGQVPCAGVSACFSRRAMLALNEGTQQQPFNTDTLTEDYDIGLRLKKLGMHEVFVKFPVAYEVRRKRLFGLAGSHTQTFQSLIATREYFPSKWTAAVRQKARWLLGIAFQGWAQVGWPGTLAMKYLLFRDRKTIVTSFVAVLAYFLVLNYLMLMLIDYWRGEEAGWRIHTLGGWLELLFWANLILLVNRAAHRFYFVTRNYGWEQGLMSLPRMVVGNVINAAAAARALRQWVVHLITGRPIAWDKTEHEFPSADLLRTHRRNLGELLLSWHTIEQEHLQAALEQQQKSGQQLGHILVERGLISDELLADAISVQNGLPRGSLDLATALRERHLLPLRLMVLHKAVPLGQEENGVLRVAATGPLGSAAENDIGLHAPQGIRVEVVTESELARALRALNQDSPPALTVDSDRPPKLLGDVLVDGGILHRDSLLQALQGFDPATHGNLGGFLVHRQLITPTQLDLALAQQAAGGAR